MTALPDGKRQRIERELRHNHDPRSLRGVRDAQAISRDDEERYAAQAHAREATAKSASIAEYRAQAAKVTADLEELRDTMRRNGMIDRASYKHIDNARCALRNLGERLEEEQLCL